VRWYLMLPIGYRDLELTLLDRGVEVNQYAGKAAQPDPRVGVGERPAGFGMFPVPLSLRDGDLSGERALSGMRRSRHCDDTTLSSLSVMLNQLPDLGRFAGRRRRPVCAGAHHSVLLSNSWSTGKAAARSHVVSEGSPWRAGRPRLRPARVTGSSAGSPGPTRGEATLRHKGGSAYCYE
jgi:hypothetical protein